MLKFTCQFFLLVLVTIFLALGLYWESHNKFDKSLIHQLDDWELQWGDSTEKNLQWIKIKDLPSMRTLSVDRQYSSENASPTMYWLKIKLPDFTYRDPALFLLIYGKYEVFIEDKQIYQHGLIEPTGSNKFYPTPPRLITLPEDAIGKNLFVRVQSLREPVGPRGETLLGESSSIILSIFKEENLQIHLSIICLFIATVIFILFLSLKNQPVFLGFAWFTFSLGVYLVARTDSKDFYVDFPSTWAFIECISLASTVTGFLYFLKDLLMPFRSQFIMIGWRISLVFTLSLAFMILFTDASLNLILTSMQIEAFCAVSLIIIVLIRNALTQRDAPTSLFLAILLLAFCALHDILSYYWLWSYQITLFKPGILMFLLILTIGLCQKISKRWRGYIKELEKRNMELDELNRFKNQVLTNTSHELKTPLHGIIGIAQVLLNQADANQRKNLEIIVNSGKRLNHLINDILDLNNMELKQLQLYPTPFYLRAAVEQVYLLLEPIKKKDVIFINEVPDFHILADENRMLQILSNILGNSFKLTTKGTIKVTAEYNEQDQLLLKVEDTGPGIAKEHIEYIFKEFYLPTSVVVGENRIIGSGLGLTVTKRLVEIQGGVIRVNSSLGEGTSFLCTFNAPLIEKIEENIIVYPDQFIGLPDQQFQASILIVEDEEINQEIIRGLLKEITRWELHFAFTAEQALKMAHTIQPDLIILDSMLPDADGFEVCRQLREIPPIEDLKIIILTARGIEDAKIGYKAGANEYLLKPIDPTELINRISSNLQARWFVRNQKQREFTERQIKFLELAHQHPHASKEDLASMMFVKYETLKKDVVKINQEFNSRTYMEAAFMAKKRNII